MPSFVFLTAGDFCREWLPLRAVSCSAIVRVSTLSPLHRSNGNDALACIFDLDHLRNSIAKGFVLLVIMIVVLSVLFPL